MKKCMITLKLTALFFSIVISGILNAFSVYLPYWNLDKSSQSTNGSVIFQKGLFPIHWKRNPTFFNAVTVMMLASSGVLMCLFLMFLLSLMAILRRSACQVKIGFRLCAVFTVLAGLFQLYSFIIMAIEFSLNRTPNWRIGGSKIMGACEYLALVSAIIDLFVISYLSIILSRISLGKSSKRNSILIWT